MKRSISNLPRRTLILLSLLFFFSSTLSIFADCGPGSPVSRLTRCTCDGTQWLTHSCSGFEGLCLTDPIGFQCYSDGTHSCNIGDAEDCMFAPTHAKLLNLKVKDTSLLGSVKDGVATCPASGLSFDAWLNGKQKATELGEN